MNKEPNPAAVDAPPQLVDIEDLDDQVAKRMQALRDATEENEKDKFRSLIAFAIYMVLPYICLFAIHYIGNSKLANYFREMHQRHIHHLKK